MSTNGTSLTTDTEATGATPADPMQASISSPNSGPLSIGMGDAAGATLSGYSVFRSGRAHRRTVGHRGKSVVVHVRDGLRSVTGGTPASSIAVFRNGVLLPIAPDRPGLRVPDPCVSARVDLPNGNVQITALSSAASVWAVASSRWLSCRRRTSATVGQTVTFTATRTSPTTPSASLKGTMHFYDGATLLATKAVKAGVASLITKKLAVGSHAITAHVHGRGARPRR